MIFRLVPKRCGKKKGGGNASSQQPANFFQNTIYSKKTAQYCCIVFITVNKITPWKVVKLLASYTFFSFLPRRFAFRRSPSLASSGFVPRVWLGLWLRLGFWLQPGLRFWLRFFFRNLLLFRTFNSPSVASPSVTSHTTLFTTIWLNC